MEDGAGVDAPGELHQPGGRGEGERGGGYRLPPGGPPMAMRPGMAMGAVSGK
jgi:hypothetical protein